MSRIFLDVGANRGQTLKAVLDLSFDQIICFEPVAMCWETLIGIAIRWSPVAETLIDWESSSWISKRIRIEKFGLWKETCQKLIYAPESKGGSLWKKDKATSDKTELCQFVRASDWFKENLDDSDTVFMKLNVEGAECDILDDLLDSGEFRKVSFAMIDFDVRKITSQKHRQAELEKRLESFKFPRVAFAHDVMVGATHQDRIRNWLRLVERGGG